MHLSKFKLFVRAVLDTDFFVLFCFVFVCLFFVLFFLLIDSVMLFI